MSQFVHSYGDGDLHCLNHLNIWIVQDPLLISLLFTFTYNPPGVPVGPWSEDILIHLFHSSNEPPSLSSSAFIPCVPPTLSMGKRKKKCPQLQMLEVTVYVPALGMHWLNFSPLIPGKIKQNIPNTVHSSNIWSLCGVVSSVYWLVVAPFRVFPSTSVFGFFGGEKQ